MANKVQTARWSWGAKLLLVLVLLTAGVLAWQAIQPWLQRPLHQIILQTDRVEFDISFRQTSWTLQSLALSRF